VPTIIDEKSNVLWSCSHVICDKTNSYTTNYCSWQVLTYVCRRILWWTNMGVHCSRKLNYVGRPTHALGEQCTLTSFSSSSWYSSFTLIIRVHSVYILNQLLTTIIENFDMMTEWVWRITETVIKVENENTEKKTCSIPKLSTKNPTRNMDWPQSKFGPLQEDASN